jgi:ketosteroid isomerase-like protein
VTTSAAMMETIICAYAARDKGDIDGLMAAFHPNAVFELAGASHAPEVTGAANGHGHIRTALADFIAAFEFIKRDIIGSIVERDRAAVHSRLQVRFIPNNHRFTSEVLDVITFKDGKIIELVEFADPALIKDAMSNPP